MIFAYFQEFCVFSWILRFCLLPSSRRVGSGRVGFQHYNILIFPILRHITKLVYLPYKTCLFTLQNLFIYITKLVYSPYKTCLFTLQNLFIHITKLIYLPYKFISCLFHVCFMFLALEVLVLNTIFDLGCRSSWHDRGCNFVLFRASTSVRRFLRRRHTEEKEVASRARHGLRQGHCMWRRWRVLWFRCDDDGSSCSRQSCCRVANMFH